MNAEQSQQLPPPPPALLSTETYANYNAISATTAGALQPATTTYVTIGMLAPPPPAVATISAACTPGTTTTFKTPLLPMPTLEDIEGGMLPTVGQPIPGGILKYPTSSTITMSLPMGMGPGPPPVPSQPPPPPPRQSPPPTLGLSEACGTLKSNAKLLLHTTATTLPLLPPPAAGISSTVSSTISSNIAAGSNNCNASSTTNISSRPHASSSISGGNNVPPPKVATGYCCCFGRRRADAHPSSTTKKKKSKQKGQTLWSALLTNLGICALLLAYTLLGSFIFLTIESEDSTLLHQQRTLASTKRGGGSGSASGRGGVSISKSAGGNIYHTQQQQQPPSHHMDNGTIETVASSPTSSSSASSQSMLEGIVSLNSNNDFIYGDEVTPQLALSADTYDVRQRTIENIWDITVSLNILYKENWTKLAALEIAKFQDQLIKRLNEDAVLQLSHDLDAVGGANSPATEAVLLHTHQHVYLGPHEWNFARAFFYSLTVLTTIGYGNIAPRTTLGRLVTLAYAIFGIPLTLVYLSSTGGILAKVAREVFSKVLCCCLCSNCGYCCYDEKRMAEKERRMRRKRQQEEMRKQQAAMQEPYYVRSGSMHDNFQTPEKQQASSMSGQIPDIDSLSASESRGSMHGLSILAPILLCLSMMIIYIVFGAVVLYRLENWPLLDGIYFCFMSLSTIGFGDMVPGQRRESTTTTWFCSIYIMSGMALTAMCFNVIHEEIVHRIKIVVEFKKGSTLDTTNEDQCYYMPT